MCFSAVALTEGHVPRVIECASVNLPTPHQYRSTACEHGLHQPRCRRTCKFCGRPCICHCHQGEDPGEDTELRDRLRETVRRIDLGQGTYTQADGTTVGGVLVLDLAHLSQGEHVIDALVNHILDTLAAMPAREGPYRPEPAPKAPPMTETMTHTVPALPRLLMRAADMTRGLLDDALADYDLTYVHYQVLEVALNQDGLSCTAFAAALDITPQSLPRLLELLSTKGYVERRRSATHSRVLQVHITAAGREALGRAVPVVKAVQDRLFEDLRQDGADGYTELGRLLEKLFTHLAPRRPPRRPAAAAAGHHQKE